jgi:hypothetical protein
MRRHLAPHPDSGPVIAARATLYGDERWVLYSTAAATRRALPTRRWSSRLLFLFCAHENYGAVGAAAAGSSTSSFAGSGSER